MTYAKTTDMKSLATFAAHVDNGWIRTLWQPQLPFGVQL